MDENLFILKKLDWLATAPQTRNKRACGGFFDILFSESKRYLMTDGYFGFKSNSLPWREKEPLNRLDSIQSAKYIANDYIILSSLF